MFIPCIFSCSTVGTFEVYVLVTLLNAASMPVGPDSNVLDQVTQLIQQLANQQLQIQDFSVQRERIQRFG